MGSGTSVTSMARLVRRKPWMNFFALSQAKLGEDVALDGWRGRRGECDDRGRTQGGKVLAEHAVVGAKIMAPLGDAVGFVDGDQGRLALGEHLGEAGDAKAFRGDEEELERAVEVVDAGLAADGAVESGVNAGYGEALRGELGALVFDEGDERAYDQGRSAAGDGGS